MIHTILGAGGAIANALANELMAEKQKVRLVSRSGFSIVGAEAIKADITSYQETLQSIRNSDIVYLCVGLTYNTALWKENWPKIMRNTIDACKQTGAKLIFFDNVYMYGKVEGKMIESTPYNPCSKKGEIRAQIAMMLEDEFKKENITGLIARAADLYGPYISNNSMPYMLIIDKFLKGKKAQWLIDVEKPHSYTYTLDCAKSMYLLATTEKAYKQVWHLPTYNPPINTKTIIEIAAIIIGVNAKYTVLPKFAVRLGGLFDGNIREVYEMLYQIENAYYFDSTKFDQCFNYKPITYEKGLSDTIDFFRGN